METEMMQKITIWLYPGFLTKGIKGRLFWHPKMPSFNDRQSDWMLDQSVDVTNCINDPWPFSGGGPDCILEIKAV